MLASATAATAIAPIIPSMRTGDQRLTRLGGGEVTAAREGWVGAGRAVVAKGAGVAEAMVDTTAVAAIKGVVATAGAFAAEGVGVIDGAVATGGDGGAEGAPALISSAQISLAVGPLAAIGASTGVGAAFGAAAATRPARIPASASSAARDNSCMSSGLSTISMVSSSRLS